MGSLLDFALLHRLTLVRSEGIDPMAACIFEIRDADTPNRTGTLFSGSFAPRRNNQTAV
jgi:hypothetical protein